MSIPSRLRVLAGGMLLALAGAGWAGEVEETLQRLVKANRGHGGGVVCVTDRDGERRQYAAGSMAGPGSAAMRTDTPFEIASITKMVTAATVLRLVEEGKFTLDSTLADVLPEEVVKGFEREITLRQLLSHTSGLPDYWTDGQRDWFGRNVFRQEFDRWSETMWFPEKILIYARTLPMGSTGRFHYADTNYVLLGMIVERATGKSLHEVFREMIFDPLGMRDTWMSYREPQRGVDLSHRFEGEDDLHAVLRQSADWAGGGLVSTAADLDRLLRGLADGKLFRKQETMARMLYPISTRKKGVFYGLGVYLVSLGEGRGVLWGHDGHGNSFAYYWPKRGLTITGTLNQTENDWWPLAEAVVE